MKSTVKLPPESNGRLREVRKAMRYSMEDMANLLGFSYQTYSSIEVGRKNLYIDRLEPLRKTKANVDYIISGEGELLNETKTDYFMEVVSKLDTRDKEILLKLALSMLEKGGDENSENRWSSITEGS